MPNQLGLAGVIKKLGRSGIITQEGYSGGDWVKTPLDVVVPFRSVDNFEDHADGFDLSGDWTTTQTVTAETYSGKKCLRHSVPNGLGAVECLFDFTVNPTEVMLMAWWAHDNSNTDLTTDDTHIGLRLDDGSDGRFNFDGTKANFQFGDTAWHDTGEVRDSAWWYIGIHWDGTGDRWRYSFQATETISWVLGNVDAAANVDQIHTGDGDNNFTTLNHLAAIILYTNNSDSGFPGRRLQAF